MSEEHPTPLKKVPQETKEEPQESKEVLVWT